VEPSRKRPTKSACREGRGTPIASTETPRALYSSVKPKVSFRVSFHAGPFGKSERSQKGNSLGKGLENRTSACRASNALGAFGCSSKRTQHVRSPALRGTRAARDARDLARRAIDGRASTRPRESRARAGVARAELATRARAPGGPTGKIPHPVKTTIFPGPEKSDARGSLAYRRVERPRGVRSNLGSDVG